MYDFTSWSRDLRVSADGVGVVAMAGGVPLRMLADRTGLTERLSAVLARSDFLPVHDRGRVLTDVVCTIGCGARDMIDVEGLRAQALLYGPIASDTTVGRALAEVGAAGRARIAAARAAARAHVWSLLPAGPRALSIAGCYSMGEQVVVRVDASIVECHSRKQGAAGTYKGGFGHMPVGAWIDNTGELGSLLLRPGNAAASNPADLILTLDEAIGQIPAAWRGRLLVTSDTAGASHELIGWLDQLNTADNGTAVEYSIGWDITDQVRAALGALHPESWVPALDAVTGQMTWTSPRSPTCWPTGCKRAAGHRTCASSPAAARWPMVSSPPCSPPPGTSSPRSPPTRSAWATSYSMPAPPARPGRGRSPHHQRHWPGPLPLQVVGHNLGWAQAICLGVDLLAWFKLLGDLPSEMTRAEPNTLRYWLLHTPARITRGQRQRRLPAHWPWSKVLAHAITTIARLPRPALT